MLLGKVRLTQIQALFTLKKYQQAKKIAHQLVKNPTNKEKATRWLSILDSQKTKV